ncbi:MAG: undecaprenyldiphospho-muramoylpentapeptide beta-N-acetylglucosaminyltransferase [Myxococcota bacterium]
MKRIMRKRTKRLIIAGGGTGGHFYTGVALAEEWLSRDKEASALFVGTERGIEAREAPALGFEIELLRVLPLKRIGFWQKIKALAVLPFAVWDAYKIVRASDPDYVISVGGYAAGPVGVAAWLCGKPLLILEQNSVPGFTNKVLSFLASRIFVAFSNSARYFFNRKKVVVSGNPLRKSVVELALEPKPERGSPLLVITGGSQGAVGMNQLVLDAIKVIKDDLKNVEIIHQCGEVGFETTRERYAELGLRAEVKPFMKDIVRHFFAATLIISRAGATTISEILALAVPALYIPFPFAADDHQRLNVSDSVVAGAALSFDQFTTAPEVLAAAIKKILFNAKLRAEMTAAAKKLGKPHSAKEIIDAIMELKT